MSLVEVLQSKNYHLIDVREPAEFAGGRVPGAKLIPLGEIEKRHKRRTIWITTVKMSNGSYREFSQDAQPNWGKGTAVRSTEQGLVRY